MTASFAFMPRELAADGPVLRFDLATAVPEPATYAMLLGGLGLIGLARRRAVKHVD
jgi:PEP-CTERM motif